MRWDGSGLRAVIVEVVTVAIRVVCWRTSCLFSTLNRNDLSILCTIYLCRETRQGVWSLRSLEACDEFLSRSQCFNLNAHCTPQATCPRVSYSIGFLGWWLRAQATTVTKADVLCACALRMSRPSGWKTTGPGRGVAGGLRLRQGSGSGGGECVWARRPGEVAGRPT